MTSCAQFVIILLGFSRYTKSRGNLRVATRLKLNKINWGKLSIIFHMLLVFGFLTISCGSFSCAETLPQLNQSTDANRSYTFTPDESATLEENMGETSPGSFTITGLDKSSNNILFNSFSGFVIDRIQTTLKISDVTITGAQSTVGAVIYNTTSDASITLSNLNIEGNSVLSQGDALGGAIYANSELTITNTSFKGNSAVTQDGASEAKGGAIYTRKSIELIADSDNVEIVDNYTEDSSGQNDNAIYVDNNSATLKLNAKHNGRIDMHDNVDGANGYNVEITGDGTGKVGLYNSINNAGNISVSNVDITTANGEIENHKLDNLDVGNNVNFTVDVDLANGTADTITSNNGSGTINLAEISVIDAPTSDSTTVQVLKDADGLTLNIEKLQEKQVTTVQGTMYNSTVLAESLALGTTDTTNDSVTITGWQDTLNAMMNDSNPTHMIKNFIFNTDTEYVLTQNLDEMVQESILTIYNRSSSDYGVINANGHSVFKLNNPISTITLRDIEIKDAATTTNGSVVYITNNTASFTTYNTKLTDNSADGNGGVIYSTNGTITLNNTEISGNSSGGNGGAIYATQEANLNITNTNFTGNSTNGKGGAIYTDVDVNITAKDGSSTFEGNTANGESNAIYAGSEATVTLNAQDNGSINIEDKISGDNGYKVNITGTSKGNVNLDNNIENAIVTLNQANLNLADDSLLSGNSFVAKGGTLNMINGTVGSTNFSNYSMNGKTNVQVDVDLFNETMDRITSDNYGSINGTINVNKMNILSEAKKRKTVIYFADPEIRRHVKTSIEKVRYSKVYRYIVKYHPENGYFTFNRGTGWDAMDFNPAVLAAPIAQQVAYMNQLQNYDAAMYHSDSYMMLPKCVREGTGNIYNEEFDTITYVQIQEELKSIWVRSYSSFEHVHLDRGPKVSLINYGTVAGGESDMIDLGKGFKYVYGGYLAYNGNNYHYSHVESNQQGVSFGVIGYLYKGNFFNTATANVGWMINNSDTDYGTDIINLIMTGFSDRIGYNIELAGGKVIIQPSLTAGYSLICATNYKTSDGVSINSDPLSAIHFVPGIKIIGNLANGWQPYATVKIVASYIDKTHMKANGIQAPLMSLDPYVEYGLGVQKRWGDKYSGYAQATVRNGGRRGAALLFGFRYMLGQIMNVAHKPPHTDAQPRKVFFKEKKRADITIEPIRSRFGKKDRKVKKEKGEKPKFKIKVLDLFKKKPKEVIYNYNTDVSAKVVTDVYDDGVIMPSINGMKNNNSGMDFQDQDRINKIKPQQVKVAPAKPQTQVKTVKPEVKTQTVQPKVQTAQPKAEVKPVEQKVQTAQPKAEVKPIEQKVQTTQPKAETKPSKQKSKKAQPKAEVKPVEQKVQTTQPKAEVKPAAVKTNSIQRRTKQSSKTMYMNQTKYETKKPNTYRDYEVEVVEFSF